MMIKTHAEAKTTNKTGTHSQMMIKTHAEAKSTSDSQSQIMLMMMTAHAEATATEAELGVQTERDARNATLTMTELRRRIDLALTMRGLRKRPKGGRRQWWELALCRIRSKTMGSN